MSPAYRWAVALLTVAIAGVVTVWSVLMPLLRAPDELQHLNSVVRLVDGGGWPDPGHALVRDDVAGLAVKTGLVADGYPLSFFYYTGLPNGTLQGGPSFLRVMPEPDDERAPLATLSREGGGVDQMTQHPPLFYAVAAGAYVAVGADDWAWDDAGWFLRLLSVAMVAAAVPFVAGTARRVSGSEVVGVVACASLLLIPQFAHIAGTITNDSLQFLLVTILVYLCARGLTGDASVRNSVLLAVVAGLALLVKGLTLAVAPLVVAAVLVAHWRSGPKRLALHLLGVGAGTLAVGGWWWVRNLLVFGTVQPTAAAASGEVLPWGDAEPTLGKYLELFVANHVPSFWGEFGWLEIPPPTWLVVLLSVALGLALVRGTRILAARDPRLLVLLTLPLCLLGIVMSGSFDAYMRTGMIQGVQGRYLFPALACTLTFAAVGAMPRRPGRGRRLVPVAVLLAGVVVTVAAAVYALTSVYLGDHGLLGAVELWAAWAPLSASGLLVLVAVVGLAVLVAVVGVTRVRGALLDVEETSSHPDDEQSGVAGATSSVTVGHAGPST